MGVMWESRRRTLSRIRNGKRSKMKEKIIKREIKKQRRGERPGWI